MRAVRRSPCGSRRNEGLLRSIQHIFVEGIALHWIMRFRTMLLGIVAMSQRFAERSTSLLASRGGLSSWAQRLSASIGTYRPTQRSHGTWLTTRRFNATGRRSRYVLHLIQQSSVR